MSTRRLRELIRDREPIPFRVLALPSENLQRGQKGVLLSVPRVLESFVLPEHGPALRESWYTIDAPQSNSIGYSESIDLHLAPHEDLIPEFLDRNRRPDSYLILGDGDFVDTDVFRPLRMKREYDLVLSGSWSPVKNLDFLVEALFEYRKFTGQGLRVLMVQYDCIPGHIDTYEEAREYERRIRGKIDAYELPVDILDATAKDHRNGDGSFGTGVFGKDEMNEHINRCRAGILVSEEEGMNRFVCECLAADRPVIVPGFMQSGVRRLVGGRAGLVGGCTPTDFASSLRAFLAGLSDFRAREEYLAGSGFHRSNELLARKIREIAAARGESWLPRRPFAYGGDMWSRDYYELFLPIIERTR